MHGEMHLHKQDPVFSLYLNPNDNYTTRMLGGLLRGEKASNSSSEIIFGRVNQDHYQDCLQWHDLGQFRAKGDVFKGFWGYRRRR
jgi:hypothetical protein